MTWKSVMRAAAAEAKRRERAAIKSQRELERAHAAHAKAMARAAAAEAKAMAKAREREEAEYMVAKFENLLDRMQSIHKDCGPTIAWSSVASQAQPSAPAPDKSRSTAAVEARSSYKPGLISKLLFRTKKEISQLDAEVEAARIHEAQAFKEATEQHKLDVEAWSRETTIAKAMLAHDTARYPDAVKLVNSLQGLAESQATVQELAEFSTTISLVTNTDRKDAISVEVVVADPDIVPAEQLTLTKSGKASKKAMPKGRALEIYQDYVCSAALRAARELLAALPIQHVLTTAKANVFNSATGNTDHVPILSLVVSRQIADRLNFDALDPSDSMANFPHNMKFKKTKGFEPVDQIGWDEIPAGVTESLG